ncbi:hypothetical protein ColKHC_09492 [Colletotrichum higginsianum]|nr:hypothetical protein ColKHC_09492 [Colletotrichum higginsianum]
MADRFKCPALPRYFLCFDAYIRQGTWCAHATLLFNIDTEDILMTEAEKHQSLAWLSEKLTMAERMRGPSRNKVVRAVQEMIDGTNKNIDHAMIYTALLRYRSDPPLMWSKRPIIASHLQPLRFLFKCMSRKETYTADRMRAEMSNVDRPLTVKSLALDGARDGATQTEAMGAKNGGSGDELRRDDDFIYLEYFDDFK